MSEAQLVFEGNKRKTEIAQPRSKSTFSVKEDVMRERAARQKSSSKNMKQHLEVINECSNSEIKSINSSAIKSGINFAHREKPSGLKVKLKHLDTSVEDEIIFLNESKGLIESKVDSEDKLQKLYGRALKQSKKVNVEKDQTVNDIKVDTKQCLEKQGTHNNFQPKDNEVQRLDDVEANSINQIIVTDYKSREDDMECSSFSEGGAVNSVNHKGKAAVLSHIDYSSELKKTPKADSAEAKFQHERNPLKADEEVNRGEIAVSLEKSHAHAKIHKKRGKKLCNDKNSEVLGRESPEEVKSDVNTLHRTKEFDTNKFAKGTKRSRNYYKTQEEIGNGKLGLVNLALSSDDEVAANKLIRSTPLSNGGTTTLDKFNTSPKKKRLDVNNKDNAEGVNNLIKKAIRSLDQRINSDKKIRVKETSNPLATTRSNDRDVSPANNRVRSQVKHDEVHGKAPKLNAAKNKSAIPKDLATNKVESKGKIKSSISTKNLKQSNSQQAKRFALKTSDIDAKAVATSSPQMQSNVQNEQKAKASNEEADGEIKADQKSGNIIRQASKRLSVSSGNLAFSRISCALGRGRRISNFENFNRAVHDFYKAPQAASEDAAPKSVAEALRIAQEKNPKRFHSAKQVVYPSIFLAKSIEAAEDVVSKELLTGSNEHTAIYSGTLWRYMPGFAVHFQPRFCLLTNSAFLYFESKSKAFSRSSKPLARVLISDVEAARRVKAVIPEAKQIVRGRKGVDEALALPKHQFEVFLKKGKSGLESPEAGQELKHASVRSSSKEIDTAKEGKRSGSYLPQTNQNQQVSFTLNK